MRLTAVAPHDVFKTLLSEAGLIGITHREEFYTLPCAFFCHKSKIHAPSVLL